MTKTYSWLGRGKSQKPGRFWVKENYELRLLDGADFKICKLSTKKVLIEVSFKGQGRANHEWHMKTDDSIQRHYFGVEFSNYGCM